MIWTRGDRVYLAAEDSVALAPGDLLTFTARGKVLASGEVKLVPARDLAAAKLTAGSFARARLDRVRVLAERPPVRPMPLLRVGVPDRGRSSLLFACAPPAPRPPLEAGAYRTDSLAENAVRMVRTAGTGDAGPWPDTILIRSFAEASDQEIALERRELDVAIFWPGEASAHLRADPRWRGSPYGSWPRGALAASGPEDAATALSPGHPALAALNADLFRGDLEPWRNGDATPAALPGAPGATAPESPARPPGASAPGPEARFEVDPSCPGRAALERFLERAGLPPGAGSRSASGGPEGAPGAIRIFCLDAPAASDPARVVMLFRARCLVACEPGLRAYVAALGADALVRLLDCAPAAP